MQVLKQSKVVNNDLAELIEEASDPTSENYMMISASWELGFSDFNIVLLKDEDKNLTYRLQATPYIFTE